MLKLSKKRLKKVGLPPGTPVYVGEKKDEKIRISVINYDEERFEEKELEAVEDCFAYSNKPGVTWLNVDGIHQVEVIEKIGKHFDLHPLIQEDIVNTEQRPKVEDFEHYAYIVLKMIIYDEESKDILAEQVSFILGQNYVISFQEMAGDIFDSIRSLLRNGKGRIRKMGADYLAYCLIDAIVDHYFVVLERLGERIEELEEELVAKPGSESLHELHILKREMIILRKSVWPLREVISGMERGVISLVEEATRLYLKDVYDHTIQVIDTVETYRDMLSGMHETYLSSISNRMNEVIKVLTIIATIFIPLTFIAGIYGMNFKFMPELEWRFGYFGILLVMGVVALAMAAYFKAKKWF